MRVISLSDLKSSPQVYQEMTDILKNDGIVCIPTGNHYRLLANALSQEAVIKFLQIKKRTKKAPTLVFVPDEKAMQDIVANVPVRAKQLINTFWPGSLTLLFELHPDLPKKIRRNLIGTGKVGIRVPNDPVAVKLLQHYNGPLLVSSANLSRKVGATSEAQIRKNFGRWLDLFVSAGDLKGDQPSTVLDVTTDPPVLMRPGIVDGEEILQVWKQHTAPQGLSA